jgi:hypothetical protein
VSAAQQADNKNRNFEEQKHGFKDKHKGHYQKQCVERKDDVEIADRVGYFLRGVIQLFCVDIYPAGESVVGGKKGKDERQHGVEEFAAEFYKGVYRPVKRVSCHMINFYRLG